MLSGELGSSSDPRLLENSGVPDGTVAVCSVASARMHAAAPVVWPRGTPCSLLATFQLPGQGPQVCPDLPSFTTVTEPTRAVVRKPTRRSGPSKVLRDIFQERQDSKRLVTLTAAVPCPSYLRPRRPRSISAGHETVPQCLFEDRGEESACLGARGREPRVHRPLDGAHVSSLLGM